MRTFDITQCAIRLMEIEARYSSARIYNYRRSQLNFFNFRPEGKCKSPGKLVYRIQYRERVKVEMARVFSVMEKAIVHVIAFR